MAVKKIEPNNTNNHNARVKLRWMELDVEGGTADLVEGFKSFATALTRGNPVATPTRTLSPAPAKAQAGAAVIDFPAPTETVLPEEPVAEETNPTEELESEAAAPSVNHNNDKPRKFPKPKFLSDLDLTQADVKLDEFFQRKNPQDLNEKYLVVIAWFDEHRKVTPITANHIFTAFKSLGIQSELPEDIGWPLRYLKKQNLIDSAGRGAFKIIWNGTQAVEKMGVSKA